MPHPHLSDWQLHAVLESGQPDDHLAACPTCQSRLEGLDTTRRALLAAEDAAFDRAFSDARVAASHARVLAAVAEQRSARVVPFPGAQPPTAPSLRARPRWMAAAAAGLIVGLALGRWTHGGRMPGVTPAPATQTVFQPAVYAPADDDLLDALESASLGPISVVRTLHELTPIDGQFDLAW